MGATVEFKGGVNRAFPVKLAHEDDDIWFSVEEAKEILEKLPAVIEQAEGKFVQVAFSGSTYPYTYRDPSASLQVGDYVLVPFGVLDRIETARVAGLGKGSYKGPYKDVKAKLVREDLA